METLANQNIAVFRPGEIQAVTSSETEHGLHIGIAWQTPEMAQNGQTNLIGFFADDIYTPEEVEVIKKEFAEQYGNTMIAKRDKAIAELESENPFVGITL